MSHRRLRGNILGGLLAFLLILGVWILAALFLTSAAASPLQFPFNLQSGLAADYQADPVGARIYGLRLAIVQGLGGGGEGQDPESIPDSLKEMMSQPVPSATPRPATPEPSQSPSTPATAAPTDTAVPTETPSETPSETPTPTLAVTSTATTGAAALSDPELDCANLSFTGVWVDGPDDLRARVRNNNHTRAYLTYTEFDWPDVPSPAYVDWLDFGTRYTPFGWDDDSSPTTIGGTWVSIHQTSTRTWTANFDDEPAQGIYGGFKVTLTFEYPGWGTCVIEGSTYKSQPPTLTASPTKTPSRTPTATKTSTPGAVPTEAFTSAPTETPSETPSNTPEPPTGTPTPVPT